MQLIALTVGRLEVQATRTRLDTTRLTLEPLSQAHADALYGLYRDPQVARFLFTKPSSRQEFDEIHRQSVAFGESYGMWAVVATREPAVIGRIGFYAFGKAERPELAFLLASAAWGQGYAMEACPAALCHACHIHAWREVVAIVQPANAPAIRVLKKLGFSLEAAFELKGKHAALFEVDAQRFAQAAQKLVGRRGQPLAYVCRRLSASITKYDPD